MRVLGVSYGYHDSSACLVVDGEVVAASAEERFTRQKHDSNFPTYAIEACLKQGGLSADRLDQIVFHEDPHAKFSRVLCSAIAGFPNSRREFVESMKSWLGRKLWAVNTISKRLDVAPDKISYLGHHFSHAVQAFMGSGFSSAGILVVDAVGDWSCSGLYRGSWQDGKPRVERLMEIAFPDSLGLVYSAVTAYLGLAPNDDECSTMALAAFGRPVYLDRMRAMVPATEDGLYRVEPGYFHFIDFYRGPVSQRFVDELGPPRKSRDPLPFDALGAGTPVSADAQRFADIAASVQALLEERVLGLCQKLHTLEPSPRLCLAGGVSLNCVSNSRILAESPFETLYIPPDPGDGGTSVGTALYYDACSGGGAPEQHRYTPYVGEACDEGEDLAMLAHVRPAQFEAYRKPGASPTPAGDWRWETFSTSEALCDAVAARLVDRQIVGWVQGRAELGPRALGNRSILIRPDDPALATRLSRRVKERAAYRPYALSVADFDAPRTLDVPADQLTLHRWMQFAARIAPDALAQVRAAVHIDGTTRPQVCRRDDNPSFHDLLRAFGERFGRAALLNTSFNPSGYPIVTTPVEALSMFARTDMDALVLNRTVIWKERHVH